MWSSTELASIERLVTGDRCESKECHDMAIWLVSFRDEAFHWCSKHTRMQMRKATFWEELWDSGRGLTAIPREWKTQ